MNQFVFCKAFMLIVSLSLVTLTNPAYATDTDLWRDVGVEAASIDHSNWQVILDEYIVKQKNNSEEPAINLFNYSAVSSEHRSLLKQYLDTLQATDPRAYPRQEQFAYWVNLYNALTVDLILKNYPIKSITKLGPLLSFGPWDEMVAEVVGEALTLNDIEHKILRPIWQDPRIHYAVNCASIGCPNLSVTAFTADNTEVLLEQAAKDYINHARGFSLEHNKLKLSKIYKWYSDDFGGSEKELLTHIAQYVKPTLVKRLENFDGNIAYTYDWSLNEAK